MKRYFKNILSALLNKDPYQTERDDMAAKLESAGENVRRLNDLYYRMVERLDTYKRRVASLQQLVENLRDRIVDKDAIIAQQQQEYEKRSIIKNTNK